MNIKTILMAVMANTILLTSPIAFASGDHGAKQEEHKDEHGEHKDEHQEAEKGSNNGRLLVDGDFALELVLFERGARPEFRIYATNKHEKLEPKKVDVTITLTRLGGEQNSFIFTPKNDYLKGDLVVYEPHSFIVSVNAEYAGKQYHWQYETFEGRTEISANMARDMGVTTEVVGAQTLMVTVPVYGKLALMPNAQRHISARYPGEIVALNVELGQQVKKGQHLLTIESNESLQAYKIYAPMAGIVTSQSAALGEQTANDTLLTITNTDTLVAQLNVYPSDQQSVKTGAQVQLSIVGSKQKVSSTLFDLLTHVNAQQAKIYRAKIDNSKGLFSVDQFVEAKIVVETLQVPMAVKADALQSFRDFTVVYEKIGNQFEVRMLTLGRKAGEWVEVISGIKAGSEYVTGNSYLIKADIDKAGAAHDH